MRYERERFDAYARIKAEGLDQWSDLHDDLAGFQDLYQLTRDADGTIGCDQVPGLRLGSAAWTQDLVQAIAVADGVPVDVVGIVFDPS